MDRRVALVLAALLSASGLVARAQDPALEEQQAVERARAALAAELKLANPDVAELEGVAWVRFPSGALGCPRRGEMAAQVVTPGWRVVLRVGPDLWDVRVADTGEAVRVCSRAGVETKPPPSKALLEDARAAAAAALRARDALARVLGAAADAMVPTEVRPVTWPAEPADCSQPGPPRGGEGTPGFLVRLRHGGQEHLVRVEGDGARPCRAGDAAPATRD